MDVKRKLRFPALCVALALLLGGCGSENESGGIEVKVNNAAASYDELDLKAIADAIYASLETSELTLESVERVTDEEALAEEFYLDPDEVVSCEVRAASGKFGVADVCLIVAKEGCADDVAESMEQRKDDRIAEFSAYDVYDSAQIALSADVSEMERLVVLLMLDEDGKAAAKEIIESYLPED
ncbi:MAG TPA: DUF4358 domain-containing protein [Oscillospiraceae bacterium]|nr:DUF4358 domain-containing protein [Oscillospiraceae bacterium]HNW03823.1 DUF4358 domain-containing protein [Oscillospiraceae bacterium]HPW00345.1 DUF4358 domain-containing protein [Oscillospiraceae bacterium]